MGRKKGSISHVVRAQDRFMGLNIYFKCGRILSVSADSEAQVMRWYDTIRNIVQTTNYINEFMYLSNSVYYYYRIPIPRKNMSYIPRLTDIQRYPRENQDHTRRSEDCSSCSEEDYDNDQVSCVDVDDLFSSLGGSYTIGNEAYEEDVVSPSMNP